MASDPSEDGSHIEHHVLMNVGMYIHPRVAPHRSDRLHLAEDAPDGALL